jgi:hypothetical protein
MALQWLYEVAFLIIETRVRREETTALLWKDVDFK